MAEKDITFELNGSPVTRQVASERLLVDMLRYDLGSTGTKDACDDGMCGACTVLLDDRPVKSCLVLAALTDGHRLTTIEGLATDGELDHVQAALAEDAGVIINPLLADANLRGAIAQGIGSALDENIVYDAAGQLLTATLMDYTIPTAVEVPALEVAHHETPSPFTLGSKGVGESGIASSLGAIAAAIEDAFPELDLRLTELPFSPQRVWRAIHGARARAA